MHALLVCGDSAQQLANIQANSVDSCVTDPPYGIDLLQEEGVHWDHDTGKPEVWEEAFRVLKPGAFCLAFSAPRTYHKLACVLEGVGFEIVDQLQWVFGTSNPRSQDLGKLWEEAIRDALKRPDVTFREPDGFGPRIELAPDGTIVCYGTIEQGIRSIRTRKFYGLKSRLRPGYEPICLAMKPREGSILENYHKWQTGILNIRDCTIDDQGEKQTKSDTFDGFYPSDILGEIPHNQKYYYCPKTSEWERNFGVGVKSAKPSKRDKRKGMPSTEHPNDHPTVKPIALMSYLVRLVTPNRGAVLDPFAGSFSTGLACLKENMRSFVGIDLEQKHVDIGMKRFAAWRELLFKEQGDEYVKVEGSLKELYMNAHSSLASIRKQIAAQTGKSEDEMKLPDPLIPLLMKCEIDGRLQEAEAQYLQQHPEDEKRGLQP